MNSSNTVTVSKEDTKFLKDLSKTLNHQVRMLWEPFTARGSVKIVEPTHVTFVAEEQVFIDYVHYELENFRKSLTAISKSISGR